MSTTTDTIKISITIDAAHDLRMGSDARLTAEKAETNPLRVPAHRHTNPDGSTGGWVADTAMVTSTAYVGPDARVYGDAAVYGDAEVSGDAAVYGNAAVSGNARVYGDAEVSGDAAVYGNAAVSGNAWVSGDAAVYGNARVSGDAGVSGNAEVSGNARVSDPREVVSVGPIGSEHRYITCHRTDTGHQVIAGRWTGTLAELAERIADPAAAWPEASDEDRVRWATDYGAAIDMLRHRVAEWAVPVVGADAVTA